MCRRSNLHQKYRTRVGFISTEIHEVNRTKKKKGKWTRVCEWWVAVSEDGMHQCSAQSHDQKVRCFRQGSVSESRILLASVSRHWGGLFAICLPVTSRWLEEKGAVCVCECVCTQKTHCLVSLSLWGGVGLAVNTHTHSAGLQPAADLYLWQTCTPWRRPPPAASTEIHQLAGYCTRILLSWPCLNWETPTQIKTSKLSDLNFRLNYLTEQFKAVPAGAAEVLWSNSAVSEVVRPVPGCWWWGRWLSSSNYIIRAAPVKKGARHFNPGGGLWRGWMVVIVTQGYI